MENEKNYKIKATYNLLNTISEEKAYPKLKAEFNRLELDETLDNKKKNEQLAHLILEWGT